MLSEKGYICLINIEKLGQKSKDSLDKLILISIELEI